MADNTSWGELGDQIGLPTMAGGLYALAKRLPAAARYLGARGALAGAGLAAAPVTAGLTAAQVMEPTPVNAGEVPFYQRDPVTGQMVLNQNNPIVKAQAAGQNPMQPQPTPPTAPVTPPMSLMTQAMGNVPMPTPRPSMPSPTPLPQQPAPGAPLSLAPPAPGPSAQPSYFRAGTAPPDGQQGVLQQWSNMDTPFGHLMKVISPFFNSGNNTSTNPSLVNEFLKGIH